MRFPQRPGYADLLRLVVSLLFLLGIPLEALLKVSGFQATRKERVCELGAELARALRERADPVQVAGELGMFVRALAGADPENERDDSHDHDRDQAGQARERDEPRRRRRRSARTIAETTSARTRQSPRTAPSLDSLDSLRLVEEIDLLVVERAHAVAPLDDEHTLYIRHGEREVPNSLSRESRMSERYVSRRVVAAGATHEHESLTVQPDGSFTADAGHPSSY